MFVSMFLKLIICHQDPDKTQPSLNVKPLNDYMEAQMLKER